MQPGARRLLLARLCPALFNLVLAGLMLAALAALVLAGPAIAGEVAAGVPAAPWHRLPTDGGDIFSSRYPANFQDLKGLGFSSWEVDEGLPWSGLLFYAGDGLRIGALGSLDTGSGNLGAIVALKLDF